MARTQKTPRYNEYNSFANCFGSHQDKSETWTDYLDTTKPLVLELGCGRAEVSLGLAWQRPETNFVGVDVKSDRMWRAAKTALESNLTNIAFVQTDIRLLADYFQPQTVDEIWITFPDPFPRKKHSKHRMTGPSWIKLYRQLLTPNGVLHFKHDDPDHFKWSLEQFVAAGMIFEDLSFDIHEAEGREEAKIITTYERRWLKEGKPTQYAKLRFPAN